MYLQTKRLLNVFFMLIAFRLSAQNNKPELYQPLSPSERLAYRDDLPSFVKMTFQAQPNFRQVEAAFEAFEKEEKKEKAEKARKRPKTENVPKRNLNEEEDEDIYEVYYERWKRAYKPFVQSDGSIVLPTVAQYKQNILTQNRLNQRRLAPSSSASWTNIGPKETFWLKNDQAAQSACPWQVNIYAFDISKSDPSVLYACPETGGVFKTVDKGLNWTACGSNLFNFGGTAGAVEIHPTDPNTLYVGINAFLWKSTNGGDTWTDLTNCTASGVNDIAISPADPNLVMIAADNGFFRSTDAGSTWTQIYTTACYDIELNPTDATHVFILKSDGTNNQFFKSTDSGASFTLKNMGYSTLLEGRLTVTAADGNRIYALCLSSTNPPKLLKSADEGETWSDMNATFCTGGISDATGGQGYYDLSIAASQTNANELIFGLCSITKAVSTDGGTTFTYTQLGGYCGSFALHPDLQEAKAIMNNGVMETWVSTDGGLTLSTDFFPSTTNALARNKGIYSTNFWGYSQGWNEDIMVGGRYHNGNTALADFYPSGKALRMGGGEAGTGYVLHGTSRAVVFSDSKDMILPPTFYDYGQTITYNKFPNEDGYGFNASNLVIHPLYYKQQYLGEGNSLWLTKDNGITFEMVRDFGSKVRRFEISRSNSLVFYLATDAGFNKSADGGTTWTSVSLPSGRSSGSLYLAIHPNNDQELWIAFKNISGTGKVYQSTDGGSSWTNQDGTILGSLKIKNIIHTGGGVYIAADDDNGRVFYRSNSATNWTDFSTNLPISMDILKMLPFYRDGKLRVAGNRGIWETALESDIVPLALPAVDKSSTTCTRDTFYFDDYSILKHAGATWAWSFSPTPQYVSSASARNPKVVFGAAGNYTVALTVTDAYGTSTKTIPNMITVQATSDCSAEGVAGKSLTMNSSSDYFITPAFSLNKADGSNNNELTFMAWIRPNGTQVSYAGILSDPNSNCVLNLRNSNELGFHYNGQSSAWSWSSGLTVPNDEWSHVVLVLAGTQVRLYLNGKEAIHSSFTPVAIDFSAITWYVGRFGHRSDRPFKGSIEEVCFYNRALTQDEIREKRHLTKDPTTDNSLKGYFQFNETGSNIYNKAATGVASASLIGSATRPTSTAPVATGTSQRMTITTGGVKDFVNQHLKLEFPNSGTLPNGEIVVSELAASPDVTPLGASPLTGKYWVINNYGTNTTFGALTSLQLSNLGNFGTGAAANYKLYKRNSNLDGATWGSSLGSADALTTANNNTLTFGSSCNITSFSQITMVSEAALPVELISFRGQRQGNVNLLFWETASEKNNIGFDVEKSTNGVSFQKIGFVKGQGTSVSFQPYQFTDKAIWDLSYYRLKQLDASGPWTYSNTISIAAEGKIENLLEIFPNPTDGFLNVNFASNSTQSIDIELVNTLGQVVQRQVQAAELGANRFSMQLLGQVSGMYTLRVMQGRQVYMRRVCLR